MYSGGSSDKSRETLPPSVDGASGIAVGVVSPKSTSPPSSLGVVVTGFSLKVGVAFIVCSACSKANWFVFSLSF